MILYAVKNYQGQWYRRQGRGGRGKIWVDSLSEASVWTKTNGPNHIISYLANAFRGLPVPLLVKLEARAIEEIDQTERHRKAQHKKAIRKIKSEIAGLQWKISLSRETLEKRKAELLKQLEEYERKPG